MKHETINAKLATKEAFERARILEQSKQKKTLSQNDFLKILLQKNKVKE